MTFADKLITLRKKAGWSQEELAARLDVTRQSVSKWEGAQSLPDIDKIVQLSRLFGVTTDYLLKDEQSEPADAAPAPSPLPCVTEEQAADYLQKSAANAPKMALATALCIVCPVPLMLLSELSSYSVGIPESVAAGIGLTALLALVAAAVVLFMQCGASVRAYEFMEKEPIETAPAAAVLVRRQQAAFAPQNDRGNTVGTVLCILAAVPLFGAMACPWEFVQTAAVCLLLVLVACGVYAFVRVGTVQGAMDQLLEQGDYTRANKAVRGRLNAAVAAYWLVVVAVFLWYTFGPDGNGQPQYSWFIWAIAGVIFAAWYVAAKAFMKKGK